MTAWYPMTFLDPILVSPGSSLPAPTRCRRQVVSTCRVGRGAGSPPRKEPVRRRWGRRMVGGCLVGLTRPGSPPSGRGSRARGTSGRRLEPRVLLRGLTGGGERLQAGAELSESEGEAAPLGRAGRGGLLRAPRTQPAPSEAPRPTKQYGPTRTLCERRAARRPPPRQAGARGAQAAAARGGLGRRQTHLVEHGATLHHGRRMDFRGRSHLRGMRARRGEHKARRCCAPLRRGLASDDAAHHWPAAAGLAESCACTLWQGTAPIACARCASGPSAAACALAEGCATAPDRSLFWRQNGLLLLLRRSGAAPPNEGRCLPARLALRNAMSAARA